MLGCVSSKHLGFKDLIGCRNSRLSLFISGTASIDLEGHPGDREGQALETLRSIEALLDEQGGRLHDIAIGTLFHKDEETLVTYRAIAQQLGLADLPLIPVRSDVIAAAPPPTRSARCADRRCRGGQSVS